MESFSNVVYLVKIDVRREDHGTNDPSTESVLFIDVVRGFVVVGESAWRSIDINNGKKKNIFNEYKAVWIQGSIRK